MQQLDKFKNECKELLKKEYPKIYVKRGYGENDGLASNFVVELLAAALEKRTVFEIVRQYLKFSYLQIESEKKLWQWVTKRYDLNRENSDYRSDSTTIPR